MATRNVPPSDPKRPGAISPRLRRSRPTGQSRASQWAPFIRIAPMLILLVGLLLPVEVRLNFAGQTLYGYRMAWMLVTPWVVYQLFAGRLHLRFNDILLALTAMWMVLSFMIVMGFAKGSASGFSVALDVLMPYLIARLAIRTHNDFRILLLALAPVALGLAVLMVVEAVTHTRYIRDAARAVFGSLSAVEYGMKMGEAKLSDTRFGLLRATGPFSHPILAGVFFATLLPLYFFSQVRGWPKVAGILAGIGSVFSLSSAALLGLLMFGVLAIYDRVRRLVVFLNWPIFIVSAGILLLALHLVSQNGLISVLIRYTLNPTTGYYRLLIWDYGSRSVANYPWFGIGYDQFEGLPWMLPSVDAVWLALAIRHGLAVPLLLGLSVLVAIVGLAMSASRDRSANGVTNIGIAISLTMFFVLGFTVSFFGGLLIWFTLMLGVGTTLGRVSPSTSMPMRKVAVRQKAVRP